MISQGTSDCWFQKRKVKPDEKRMEKELVDLQRRQLLLYQLKVFQLWNAVKVVFQNPAPPEHHLWFQK